MESDSEILDVLREMTVDNSDECGSHVHDEGYGDLTEEISFLQRRLYQVNNESDEEENYGYHQSA